MTTIRIATDFSRHPAGRFIADGPYSGEAFRKNFLEKPLLAGEVVIVELDGTRGYGSSFLEEAFGGLVRDGLPKERLMKSIKLQTNRSSLKQEIMGYLQAAVVPIVNAAG